MSCLFPNRRRGFIHRSSQLLAAPDTGRHGYGGGLRQRVTAWALKIAGKHMIDPVWLIEIGQGTNSSQTQGQRRISGRIGQGSDGTSGTKIFVELGRYLVVAIGGLQDQESVGAQHFDKGLAVTDRRQDLDKVRDALGRVELAQEISMHGGATAYAQSVDRNILGQEYRSHNHVLSNFRQVATCRLTVHLLPFEAIST